MDRRPTNRNRFWIIKWILVLLALGVGFIVGFLGLI